MDREIWKDIPGFEKEYQASTLGRIKSLDRKVMSKNWSTGQPFYRTVPERILKPGKFCQCGHLSVTLRKGTNGIPVHQLVLRTFIGEAPSNMEVLHINGNPTDNRLLNLRYGTRTENILDVYYQGGRWRKLSIDDVHAIRFGIWCGIKGCELAKMFNISQQIISKIKCGRCYSWLK
ncbi:NUMOD4 motif-containing HNH endonuclease [uncultured Acetobacterium sp.]|uniref:NUMOD4 motif-containing HNH endonuclease n=1 Tax=uncultured Acetobacterium sp. TaxID=217139 RepID=UPI0025FC0B56|nr:NUMOD4 motif-containing HNH endonuclease [uncultured Acetobacterium sp.]